MSSNMLIFPKMNDYMHVNVTLHACMSSACSSACLCVFCMTCMHACPVHVCMFLLCFVFHCIVMRIIVFKVKLFLLQVIIMLKKPFLLQVITMLRKPCFLPVITIVKKPQERLMGSSLAIFVVSFRRHNVICKDTWKLILEKNHFIVKSVVGDTLVLTKYIDICEHFILSKFRAEKFLNLLALKTNLNLKMMIALSKCCLKGGFTVQVCQIRISRFIPKYHVLTIG